MNEDKFFQLVISDLYENYKIVKREKSNVEAELNHFKKMIEVRIKSSSGWFLTEDFELADIKKEKNRWRCNFRLEKIDSSYGDWDKINIIIFSDGNKTFLELHETFEDRSFPLESYPWSGHNSVCNYLLISSDSKDDKILSFSALKLKDNKLTFKILDEVLHHLNLSEVTIINKKIYREIERLAAQSKKEFLTRIIDDECCQS